MTTTVKTAKNTPAPAAAVTKAPKAMKAIGMADLLTGEAAIVKALASIHNRGQSLQRDVHIAACSVLRHLGEHGDVRTVQVFVSKVLLALPESYRTNALRDWFSAFGPIMFENNKPLHTAKGPTKGAIFLAQAMAEPFWKFSPEKPYVPVNVQSAIDGLIKKLVHDQDETGLNHGPALALLEQAKAASVPLSAPTVN